MSDGLKWARRMRLDVAFEIEQMERGVRRVTKITPQGPADITVEAAAALKARFAQLEELIADFGSPGSHEAPGPQAPSRRSNSRFETP